MTNTATALTAVARMRKHCKQRHSDTVVVEKKATSEGLRYEAHRCSTFLYTSLLSAIKLPFILHSVTDFSFESKEIQILVKYGLNVNI